MIQALSDDSLKLKRIFIESELPEALRPLRELANNLWWSWDHEAIALFRSIDPERWEGEYRFNPVALLEGIGSEKAQQLTADAGFMEKMQDIHQRFQEYMAVKPKADSAPVAYFSMEYGLHISLRLYSGGLGVLAGDYLKEASDSNANMVAVGMLYRHGYFEQGLSLHGDQINLYPAQKFTKLPLHAVRDDNGEWLKVSVGLAGRMVFAKVWVLRVGRINLYLLDADLDENSPEDRSLTDRLYGGDNEHRLKQEILLGIGGVRALRAIGRHSDIYHCNEGHAAFLNLERLKFRVQEDNLSFDEALEAVRASSLFTTHTPVPAGHDYFSEELLSKYLNHYTHDLGISWERFLALGKVDVHNPHERFSMSHLAIRLSQEVNGVSKLHGAVSREMFSVLYPGYSSEELHIGHVTNSVHYPSWISPELNELYKSYFGEAFLRDQSNHEYWRKIHNVPDAELVGVRQQLKQRLLNYLADTLQKDLTRRGENPRGIFRVLNEIDEDALVLGFARRFATYKRAHLLFSNLDRLAEIVNQEGRPVMFIFSGKAHPADQGGQDLIRHIVDISKRPQFLGKVVFLENYNMEMAKLLVQGVDVWLNTPTRPKEASGTSGMKAALNGVVNFSVLDGWWAEGYRPDAGWALSMARTYENQDLQNELDAETIYNILEDEIIPAYFDRDTNGVSRRWAGYMKQIIAEVAPYFTMKRMLDDYYEHFYNKIYARGEKLRAGKFRAVAELVNWKQKMRECWDNIQVADLDAFDSDNFALPSGEHFRARIQLQLNGADAREVGVEVVFFRRVGEDEKLEIVLTQPFELTATSGDLATFDCRADLGMAGVYEYGYRLYAKHPLLPHRQDFELVRWL